MSILLQSVLLLQILLSLGCTFKEGYGGKMITPEFKKSTRVLNLSHQPTKHVISYETGTLSLVSIEGTEYRQVIGADSTEIAVTIELNNYVNQVSSKLPMTTERIIQSLKLFTAKEVCGFSGPYTSGDVWLNQPPHSLKPGATGVFRATASCLGVELFKSDVELSILDMKYTLREVQ